MRFWVMLAVLLLPVTAQAKNWTIDYSKSVLGFKGAQSGQGFTGHFGKFTATIDFDPAKPETGKLAAEVDITSAATGNGEMDAQLPQGDWFNSGKFPKATFVSKTIKAGATPLCFVAEGDLSLKGISKPVVLNFCLSDEGGMTRATGTAELTRGDFDIGTGQWAGDNVVAHAVTVTVDIFAK